MTIFMPLVSACCSPLNGRVGSYTRAVAGHVAAGNRNEEARMSLGPHSVHAPSVGSHDPLRDREPQPRPTNLRRKPWREKARGVPVEPGPVVPNDELGSVPRRGPPHADLALGRRRVDGIGHEVDEYLRDLVGVAPEPRVGGNVRAKDPAAKHIPKKYFGPRDQVLDGHDPPLDAMADHLAQDR